MLIKSVSPFYRRTDQLHAPTSVQVTRKHRRRFYG